MSRTGRRSQQRSLWAKGQTMSRAELDAWRPDVGDRVWCGGHPFIIEYVNEDGSVGIAYDRPKAPSDKGTST